MPYIEINLGPDTLLLRFVGRIDYVFGRLPRADVQLRDMKVSRLHTQVFIDSRGSAFVRDLGSSGGTFIGNQRLRKGVIAPLINGMKFRIGDSKLTYYDAEPPVNAVTPPSRSAPRGLIRTNHRDRQFEGEVTVLAAERVSPDTASGPAEAPPEINPADFADRPDDLSPKPAAARDPKKRNTGIVEAPWEKRESGPVGPVVEKRVTIPPPTRGGNLAPAAMPSADIDEMGNYRHPPGQPPLPPRKPSPLPPQQAESDVAGDVMDETGRTSREPAVDEESHAGSEEVFSFRPPPPIAGDLPPTPEEDDRPRVGMPTVRLERPALADRQRQIEEEEAAEAAALRIPTASVKADDVPAPADEDEPAPQIGTTPRDETADPDAELSDDEIAQYLGGSLSGRFGNVDFGDGSPSPVEDPDDADDEVSFGSAAQAAMADSVDIDLDDEPAPAEAAEPEAEPETASEPDDVPTYPDGDTPPPPAREGATQDRAFKPRKTRKLMKRRKDTAKITDKSNPTPPPAGAQTEALPLPASLRYGDQPVAPGAKTMFIPKPGDADGPKQPDHPTGKPLRLEENRKPTSLEDMAQGPGGDTLAMSPEMMAQLKADLESQPVKRPAPRTQPQEAPPTIGESPTVRNPGDDDDNEDEFVLDEDYAFFTPPPPTRRAARDAASQEDLLDANDFNAEIDNLPADKKKKSKDDPETLVE